MMKKGIGRNYIHALYEMYSHTTYTPKISPTELGEAIETKHGVAQGRSSSANYYSFYVSDMADSLRNPSKHEYLDPNYLAQLADDTAIFAGELETLKEKLTNTFNYSEDNYQVVNADKTKYVHLSANPYTDPITINKNVSVESVDKDGLARV